MNEDEPIFHIALPDDWAAAFQTGEYTTSTRGRSLDDEGFIHASRRDQVEDTATRFYGDLDRVVLLTIDPLRVDSEIVWEPPTPDVDELFPHVYGPIPIAAVVDAQYWMKKIDADGVGWSLGDL